VSLHPGAQERLLGFLAKMVKEKTIQIVFSTHSPNLISYLPENAIKSFYQLPNGDFGITPNSHPYAAFRRLGDIKRGKILVLVEDRLAKYVVEQAIILMADSALQEIFEVEYMQGGAECILTKRIPIFSDENRKNTLGPVST
ncbi:ATP-binding protein, partial [Acetobacter pomorum]